MTQQSAMLESHRIERLGQSLGISLECEVSPTEEKEQYEVLVVGRNGSLLRTANFDIIVAFGDGIGAVHQGQENMVDLVLPYGMTPVPPAMLRNNSFRSAPIRRPDWPLKVDGRDPDIRKKVHPFLQDPRPGYCNCYYQNCNLPESHPVHKIALTVDLVKVGDMWTCPAGLPDNVTSRFHLGIANVGGSMTISLQGFKPLKEGRIHLHCGNCGRKMSNMPTFGDEPEGAVVLQTLCPKCCDSTGANNPLETYFDANGEEIPWNPEGH